MSDSSCAFCHCSRTKLYNILKICLLIYNISFVVIGTGIIGLGVYAEVMREEMNEIDHTFFTPSVFLFVLGMFVFFFSATGFSGSLRDNLCLLKLFNILVGLCIVAEIVLGITALVYKDPAKNFVNKYVLKGLVTYYEDQDLKNIVDFIQEEFYCCGGRVYKDWEINPYHNCSAPGPSACGVPFSCCVKNSDGDFVINSMCGYDTLMIPTLDAVDTIYVVGCIDAMLDYIWANLNVMAGILLGIFLPQLVGVIMALFYIDVIKRIIAAKDTRTEERMELNIISEN